MAAVQPRVAVVTATLPANVEPPLPDVIAYGTNVSVPKNANVVRPRDRTTADIPALARKVPGGVSRRNGAMPTRTPAATRGTSSQPSRPSPPTTSAAPAATRAASTIGRRVQRTGGSGSVSPASRRPPWRNIVGTIMAPAATTSGSRPRNTHRQPTHVEIRSDSAGPTTPGTTQAVESTANIRGRSSTG